MKTFWKPSLLAVFALMVPAGESLAGTADLTVLYQNYNAAGPNDDIVEAGIQLRNNTAASIPLSSIVVRYWFTNNGRTATPACWWWKAADCAGLTVTSGSVSATGADQYVEVRFTSAAGSLAAGATTVPIDLGITFGASVSETDDYSYGTQTALAAWSKITVHDAGSAALGGVRGGTPPSASGGGTVSAEFFDDFSYSSAAEADFQNRWTLRSYQGAPGVGGAQWKASNISVVSDGGTSNRLMRLVASTNGTAGGTSHSEVLSKAQKFRFGTYATRFRFNNTPLSGSRLLADKPVETFFTITSYNDPNYSEQDFEYLPNGGWGQGNTSTMFLTSWDKNKAASPESKVSASHDGWHTLVLQVSSAGTVYFIDGVQRASHGSQFAPAIGQYLAFQLWFIELDTSNGSARTYYEDADWIYFAKDAFLSPNEVDAKVSSFRAASITRKDTVP
ncbi:cellulose binding domain-containing protein [Hyalangium versicolor]|uniref:cellulose binding domain-containing protein n=1 Tax=Hyalangium versicolor TaxID=2861190 RepID=UPI001CCD5A43|nr:cellulose binding domain-containing protein [Hyalangium versicolor]